MRGDGALSDPPNSGSRYAPEDQVMSLTTSPEGTKGQEATARSLARREEMIERLAEQVAAHILEAAAEDQAELRSVEDRFSRLRELLIEAQDICWQPIRKSRSQ